MQDLKRLDKPLLGRAFLYYMKIIWKPIPGWEGFYEASNVGVIKSVERVFFVKTKAMITSTGILRPHFDKDCYLHIGLCREGKEYDYRINQLIAKTFIPNPQNKPLTDHINGVRWDNRVENLRWATHSENAKASFEYGRKANGSKAINKLTLTGEIIKTYEAIGHVKKDGYNRRSVNEAVLRGKSLYGFKWEYVQQYF